MPSALQILHEDEHVLAVNKPPGLLVIPGGNATERTLKDVVAEHLASRGAHPYVVHRLDRGTSGVVLFACTAAAHRALNLAFDRREVRKKYVALVTGELEGNGVITVPLHAARRGKTRPTRPGERGAPSQTRWRVLEQFSRLTWLELEPLTGRQHQLRVHLKGIGHPLALDPLYGDKACAIPGPTRTPLHAAWLNVPHPARTELLVVETPLPPDLAQVLASLRQAPPRRAS